MKYILLQARNPNDIAKQEEIKCFAKQLNLPISAIHSVDILNEKYSLETLNGFDGLLVGGAGEYSVLDDDPRIKRFISFLGEMTNTEVPTFASCFGFQALVLALGGTIVKDVPNAEVGTYELETTDSSKNDPLFSEIPKSFLAQLGHQDQARVFPSTVEHLARSAATEYQALRVSNKPIYATQFHPELTYLNKKRFQRYMPIYGKLFGEEEAKVRMASHRPSPHCNMLLQRFQEIFVQK
jgi:GMP synthase (glutamine-hydrolysing)